MSEASKAAMEAARETSGRFGTQTHPVSGIELPAWNSGGVKLEIDIPATSVSWEAWEELPEWPEGVESPTLYWEYDDGKPVTYLTVGEESCKFWEGSDGGIFNTAQTFGGSWGNIMDEETLDQAIEYGDAVHKRIDEAAYSVALTAATNGKVHEAISAFGTAGPGQAITPEKVPASGPAFEAELARLTEIEDEARARRQHGCMVSAVQSVQTECPNVASFTLTLDKYLEVEHGTALDAEGNQVSEDEEEAVSRILSYIDEDDLSRYIGSEVDIQEILDTW